MNVYFTEKQISDIQIALSLQDMEWSTLAEDSEIAGEYNVAEDYENLMLQSNDISRKLYDGETKFTQKEINLLITIYENSIITNQTNEDISEEQRQALIEKDKNILQLLRSSED